MKVCSSPLVQLLVPSQLGCYLQKLVGLGGVVFRKGSCTAGHHFLDWQCLNRSVDCSNGRLRAYFVLAGICPLHALQTSLSLPTLRRPRGCGF